MYGKRKKNLYLDIEIKGQSYIDKIKLVYFDLAPFN